MLNNLKVVFMGTPEFSLNVLEMLIKNTDSDKKERIY